MRKQLTKAQAEKLLPEVVRYIEPHGSYSNGIVIGKLQEGPARCRRMKCADGKKHDLWPLCMGELKDFEFTRQTDPHLHFSVWGGLPNVEPELYKSDRSYMVRNPSLNPQKRRKLRGSLVTGEGRPAKFPRKRQIERPKFRFRH